MLEPYFDVFWNWLVELIPLWVAPNLLTLLGAIAPVIGCWILQYYVGFSAKGEAPSWAYLFAGFTYV